MEMEHPTGPPAPTLREQEAHHALARQMALCETGRHGEAVAHENLTFCAVCGREVAGTGQPAPGPPAPSLARHSEAREVMRHRLEHVESVIGHARAEIRRWSELIADAYELKARIRLGPPAEHQLTSALKSGSLGDMTQTAKLSEAAQTALINVGTNRQGALVDSMTYSQILGELFGAGLIGSDNGLTRKGTIARQAVLSARLDAAF